MALLKGNRRDWYNFEMKKIIVILILLGLGFYAYTGYSKEDPKAILRDSDFEYNAPYTCDGVKVIQTALAENGEIIRLSLPDKRVFTLEKVFIKDSETKFANEGDQIVFWIKDDSAFLDESGTTTYSGCRVIF